jgi:prevent-host-death family protein
MNMKTILSLTDARKKLFLIADEVTEENTYYTLTEFGRPKAVILSAARFEELSHSHSEPLVSPYEYGMPFFVRDGGIQKYGAQKTNIKEKEIVKAQAYVELVEKYGYSFDQIDLGVYVSVGGESSRRFMEADMVVWGTDGTPVLVFAVAPFADYERDFERNIKDLFEIGNAINNGKAVLTHLVYYSRSFSGGRAQKKISAINLSENKTFGDWEKNGRPIEKNISEAAKK